MMERERIDQTVRTILILRNPKSGARDQGQLVDQLAEELTRMEMDVRVFTDVDKVKSEVGNLNGNYDTDSKLRAVVAAGGDGTVSLLANLLPKQTPIAILPLGTENLLAKYLSLKADPLKIAKMIESGNTATLDAGRANGQLFLVMLSCGFDADVVFRLHTNRKGHINHWSYAKPIVGAIKDYKYPTIKIWGNGNEKPISGKWAFVFNVPRYAMDLPFVKDADPTDGKLDILTFRSGKLLRGLFYLFTVVIRRHRAWRYAEHQTLTNFRVESDQQVRYQVDGDPGGTLPVDVEVAPGQLKMLVPEDWKPGG